MALSEPQPGVRSRSTGVPRTRRTRRPELRRARAVTFVVSFALIASLALQDGAYDIVIRQEIALLVWWVVAAGVVAGVLLPWRRGRWPWAAVAAMGLLAAWTAISLDWTDSTDRTAAELARVVGYLGLLFLVLLAVRRKTARSAIWGAASAAAAICLVALVDRLTGSTLSDDAVIAQVGSSRLSFPLNYWNAMGTWAAMTLGLALAASVHERKPALRGLALAAIPIAASTAYLTYSRTSIAAIALAVVIVVAGSRRRWTAVAHALVGAVASAVAITAIHGSAQVSTGSGTAGASGVALAIGAAVLASGLIGAITARTGIDRLQLPKTTARVATAALLLVVCVGGAVGIVAAYPRVRDQFENRSGQAGSADPAARLTNLNGARRDEWAAALDAFTAKPGTGVGAGAFELWWNRNGTGSEFIRDAHSIYLEALAELGWPGLLFVLLLAGSLLGMVVVSRVRAPPGRREAGARLGALAVVAVFLLAAGVDWIWESTAVTALMIVVAGGAGAAIARDRRPVKAPARIVIAAFALLGCLVQLPGLVSTSDVRRSQSAIAKGDVLTAVSDARDARAAAPWSAAPVVQLALIAEATGDYDTARELLLEAAAKEPWDFRPQVLLARVAAEDGDIRQARTAYRRARRLRPLSVLFPKAPPSATTTTTRTGP